MTSNAARTQLTMSQARKNDGWLGQIVAVHTIGRYEIVELWHKPAPNVLDQTVYLAFATYIDGVSTHNMYDSMEEALVGCIAIAHDGVNTRADRYFMRSIGADIPRIAKQSAA